MENLQLLFIILLLIYIKLTIINGTKETYNGIMETLQYPEKIVFDITNPLNEELRRSSSNASFLEGFELESLGVRLSPLIYYGQDGIRYSDSGFLHSIDDHTQFKSAYTWYNATIPVYFIQNRSGYKTTIEAQRVSPILGLTIEDVENLLRNNSTNLEQLTLIFNVREWNMNIQPGDPTMDRLERLIWKFKTQWPNVKVGLEYKLHNNPIAYHNIRSLIRRIDMLIVSVDIEPKNFILCYTLFKRNLRKLLDDNYNSIRIDSSNVTIYAKLNFPEKPKRQKLFYHTNITFETFDSYTDIQLKNEIYQKYYYYLLQFAIYWINENEKEELILQTFSDINAPTCELQGSPLNELLVIPFSPRVEWQVIENNVCAVKAILDHVYSHFSSIRARPAIFTKFVDDNDTCVLTNSASCDPSQMESEICKWPKVRTLIPDINLAGSKEYKRRLLPTIQNLSQYDMPVKQIEISDYTCRGHNRFLNEIPSDIAIACDSMTSFPDDDKLPMPKFTQIISESYKRCQCMWNQSKIIVWNIKFHTKSAIFLTEMLILIELERQKFIDQFSNMTVFIRFNLMPTPSDVPQGYTNSLYCRPGELLDYELGEVILHFARIYKIPLEIANVIGFYGAYFDRGGWRSIETVRELEIENTQFPVFVARGFPEKFLLGKFPTYPCILWTPKVAGDGLQVSAEHSGTTLHIGGVNETQMTTDELEKMMLFILHKFSLVEIIPKTFDDINTILKVISEKQFIEKLEAEGSKVPRLYLRIDIQTVPQSDEKLYKLFQKLVNSALKPVGIHFLNFNNLEATYETLLNGLKKSGIMVGISLEDCVNEVNARFFNLQNFSIFHQHDYLLCNIKPVAEANNINIGNVVKYLDTTLYIQKYFQRMFPNLSTELLFRLNAVPSKSIEETLHDVYVHDDFQTVFRNKISNFLTFFADVNQYAHLYKMKFFMLPAFDDMMGERFGWWRILDFGSLANASVFVEKEAEYLGQETWRPTETPSFTPHDSPLGLTSVIIIIGVLSIVLISLITSVLVWYRRQYVILTKKEVVEFQYGMLKKGSDERKLFENLKFPEEYQIPKTRIILQNIIGKGNFGLVYKATCSISAENDSVLSVAVKIPHPNCAKESFKSLLSELKILSYVGSHPNVVGFVGAYIKEIGRGIVNIVTELCENGALQEYLRKLHSQRVKEGKENDLDAVKLNLYQLCQFAQDIALGMDFISSKKIIHGDLSTRNVLLDRDFRCKIADFGLSRKLYENPEYIKKSQEALPWRWLAIESLKLMEFTTKSDVWSYGITLWEIFSLGSVPYPGQSYTDEFLTDLENGYRMSAPIHATTQIFEEMQRCWDLNPTMRPTFSELALAFEATRNSEYVHVAVASG
ncbi:unnamed protein product [Orchesella dallaii]|uniref:Protein kinase domain-containing protein n=1 Tax=Orchesella dallaii TaxID=48710 RepID=A0ABP1QVT7_9HEXA